MTKEFMLVAWIDDIDWMRLMSDMVKTLRPNIYMYPGNVGFDSHG